MAPNSLQIVTTQSKSCYWGGRSIYLLRERVQELLNVLMTTFYNIKILFDKPRVCIVPRGSANGDRVQFIKQLYDTLVYIVSVVEHIIPHYLTEVGRKRKLHSDIVDQNNIRKLIFLFEL